MKQKHDLKYLLRPRLSFTDKIAHHLIWFFFLGCLLTLVGLAWR